MYPIVVLYFPCWISNQKFLHAQHTMASSQGTLADIPEHASAPSEAESTKELSPKEKREREAEERKFYERILKITQDGKPKDVDTSDYQFLTDFAIITVTFTVYRELQANTFFVQAAQTKAESEEEDERAQKLKALQAYETKGKFRLCQLYPLILRSIIGYYSSIALNYYEDTIEGRRENQVPIGLNDKAYAIVCSAVRKLVELQMEADELVERQKQTEEFAEKFIKELEEEASK